MTALATVCETDGVLGIVAPLALAAAVGTALVIDLDPAGPRYPGRGSLAELVDQGPRLDDLVPKRPGIAVLRNGGIAPSDAGAVVSALVKGWPNVVFRLPRGGCNISLPVVPVIPLLPGGMTPHSDRPAVYQQLGWQEGAPGPALTMPTPARGSVAALLEGRMPARSRWIRAWQQVWGMAWV